MAKKEKVTYVDDGRTLADMSGVSGGFPKYKCSAYTPRVSLKEQWQTYWNALKMMLMPMLTVILGIVVIYLIILVVFWIMY